jgi:hypothetical protein
MRRRCGAVVATAVLSVYALSLVLRQSKPLPPGRSQRAMPAANQPAMGQAGGVVQAGAAGAASTPCPLTQRPVDNYHHTQQQFNNDLLHLIVQSAHPRAPLRLRRLLEQCRRAGAVVHSTRIPLFEPLGRTVWTEWLLAAGCRSVHLTHNTTSDQPVAGLVPTAHDERVWMLPWAFYREDWLYDAPCPKFVLFWMLEQVRAPPAMRLFCCCCPLGPRPLCSVEPHPTPFQPTPLHPKPNQTKRPSPLPMPRGRGCCGGCGVRRVAGEVRVSPPTLWA